MTAISAELAPFSDIASIGASDFEGHSTRRTGAPLPRSATFRTIATHPVVLAAGDHVLGHATSWRFSAAEYIEIAPDEQPQQIHRDQWKYDMVDFEFDVELNGMWAITDFTEQNGATRVVPGSHEASNRERYAIEHSQPTEMAQGSLLLYTGSLYHGGGPNQSTEWRAGLLSCCASLVMQRRATVWATGEIAKIRWPPCSQIATSTAVGPPSATAK